MDAAHNQSKRPQRLERIGHRGAPRELPENTLASFERALLRGAKAIELDVHATADGVIVVHHDPALGRHVEPNDLRGASIASMTWADLSTVELTPGSTIPRLTDVFELIGGRATIYVELKGRGIERHVAQAIAQSSCRCAVHSFDHDAIARLRVLAPGIPRGILFDRYPGDLVTVMKYSGARDVWPTWRFINRSLVDAVHAHGGRVIAWTVNSGAAAFQLAAIGVDGVCSDDLRHIT
jgi:glycerophosphoryl diester phosphodiesterase